MDSEENRNPQMTNELVDELTAHLRKAVGDQHGAEIVGSIHIFLSQGKTPNKSATITIHYGNQHIFCCHNLLRIASDFLGWTQNTAKRNHERDICE